MTARAAGAGVALAAAFALGAAAAPAPARTLAIPVGLPAALAKDGASLECVAPCGPALPLSGAAFSPDGKWLAVGGYGEVALWDLAGAALARRMAAGKGGSMVQAVAFAKDGKRLFAGAGVPDASGAVFAFDPATGAVAAEFGGPEGPVTSLAVSPDGKLLAAGSGDGNAYITNLADGKPAAVLKFHKLAVLHVSFSGDGKFLVTGGADRAVQVWDTAAWTPDRRETRLEDTVRRCFLRSSRPAGADVQHQFALVVGGGESRSLQVRLDDKAQPWARKDVRAEMPSGTPLDAVWVPGKGTSRVYAACTDGTVKVFDETRTAFEPVATLAGHGDWVYGLAASPDGRRLASVAGDGTVKLWDLASHTLLATLAHLRPGSNEWAIVTARGYFAASGTNTVQWASDGIQLAAERLGALGNAELVRKALGGEHPPEPELR